MAFGIGTRREQGGFSLIQTLAGVTLCGILAALGVGHWGDHVKQRTLQGEAQNLVGLMRQSRSLGLKKSLPVGVTFAASHGRIRIFEDTDESGTWQDGEPVREVLLGRGLAIGAGERPPPSGPQGEAVPATGLAGTWTRNLLFAQDPLATPSEGALYIHHPDLDGWAACLLRPAASQQIQAYLWDGSSWRML